jgi:hypothetical protein
MHRRAAAPPGRHRARAKPVETPETAGDRALVGDRVLRSRSPRRAHLRHTTLTLTSHAAAELTAFAQRLRQLIRGAGCTRSACRWRCARCDAARRAPGVQLHRIAKHGWACCSTAVAVVALAGVYGGLPDALRGGTVRKLASGGCQRLFSCSGVLHSSGGCIFLEFAVLLCVGEPSRCYSLGARRRCCCRAQGQRRRHGGARRRCCCRAQNVRKEDWS